MLNIQRRKEMATSSFIIRCQLVERVLPPHHHPIFWLIRVKLCNYDICSHPRLSSLCKHSLKILKILGKSTKRCKNRTLTCERICVSSCWGEMVARRVAVTLPSPTDRVRTLASSPFSDIWTIKKNTTSIIVCRKVRTFVEIVRTSVE